MQWNERKKKKAQGVEHEILAPLHKSSVGVT